MSKQKPCDWCQRYQPDGCGDDCEFQTLPISQSAIIERMKEEMANIEKLKDEVERNPDALNKVLDKAFGISIMSKVLINDFKMKQKDINKVLGKEMSLFERTKLMAKLVMMKKSRGK